MSFHICLFKYSHYFLADPLAINNPNALFNSQDAETMYNMYPGHYQNLMQTQTQDQQQAQQHQTLLNRSQSCPIPGADQPQYPTIPEFMKGESMWYLYILSTF